MAFYDTSEYNLRGDTNNGISGSQTAASVVNAASQPTVTIGGTQGGAGKNPFDGFLQHAMVGAQKRQAIRRPRNTGIVPPTVMDSRGGDNFGGVTQPVDPPTPAPPPAPIDPALVVKGDPGTIPNPWERGFTGPTPAPPLYPENPNDYIIPPPSPPRPPTFGGVTQPVDPIQPQLPVVPPENPPITRTSKVRSVAPPSNPTWAVSGNITQEIIDTAKRYAAVPGYENTTPQDVLNYRGYALANGQTPMDFSQWVAAGKPVQQANGGGTEAEWQAYMASPRAPGKPGYVPFEEWKAINATTRPRMGTTRSVGTGATTGGEGNGNPATGGTGSTPGTGGNGGTGTGGGNSTSTNGPTYQQFDPNAIQMDDVIAQLRTFMDPANQAAQDQLARQLIHRSSVTGQINSGGDAAVFGDKMGQLINEQNAQLGQMGFAAQQAALDRALQSTKNMNDFELQKWAEANKVMLGKMGIDAQRYATDKGYQAAVISATAQQAAANAAANASMYGDDIRYKLGLVGYDVDRENNLLKNAQFYAGLGLDWAKLMYGASPDAFINGTNTTPGTVVVKP